MEDTKKHVVLGVTGGIAAYKAVEIVSILVKKDIDVKVVMTNEAVKFVAPLTFQSLSKNVVSVDTFEEPKAWEIEHISLATWADVYVVAPATANIIGKVANGIADDLLSTSIMATDSSKVVFAPAMNTNMYFNNIVQDNIKKLESYGYKFIAPASGRLACGTSGMGKLESPEVIADYVMMNLNKKDLKGKKVLVTAGPTISKIDPVRFITNRSSGKMGYRIAKEARNRGAQVVLVSGPVALKPIQGIKTVYIETNEEMKKAVFDEFSDSDIVIKAAAVADYKPEKYSTQKIKKSDSDLSIKFVRDTDILKELGKMKDKQVLVGFAAESQNLVKNAKDKLKRKNLDFIVANDITKADTGFSSDDNKVTIFSNDNEEFNLEKMEKDKIAEKLFDIIAKKRL
ncbi:bifunctional phosphopantothenoylcysteine decarboxylase/phosphopantothenate--cysteine ligase CoaBC [Clostridium sp. BJN0001]|uniref:bifunctional phosphopantothenoylcysteine decarboxylase/phosphopantothenate--cysteine ligase CoaBC n=1 Tax=Clostridium sp. BJN0001 TaxID=2930219 RepID=UPI001FD199C4|nr:bifunctional phosphopantothenoylcysteine decarboxylase/phosphopantothenate--cysteine ligase CoaBC [Clostridium sp. BJN0001]